MTNHKTKHAKFKIGKWRKLLPVRNIFQHLNRHRSITEHNMGVLWAWSTPAQMGKGVFPIACDCPHVSSERVSSRHKLCRHIREPQAWKCTKLVISLELSCLLLKDASYFPHASELMFSSFPYTVTNKPHKWYSIFPQYVSHNHWSGTHRRGLALDVRLPLTASA